MKLLFFDTETTGLPSNYNAHPSEVEGIPRMVQLAYKLVDIEGKQLDADDTIIKPEGYTIPKAATQIHGISHEMAMDEGNEIQEVIEEFNLAIKEADLIVCHNYKFDSLIVGGEIFRHFSKKGVSNVPNAANIILNRFLAKPSYCTMQSSTEFVGIQTRYGYKWPKLQELHYKLFGSYFENAHNANVDVEATVKCFFEMKRLGLIKL